MYYPLKNSSLNFGAENFFLLFSLLFSPLSIIQTNLELPRVKRFYYASFLKKVLQTAYNFSSETTETNKLVLLLLCATMLYTFNMCDPALTLIIVTIEKFDVMRLGVFRTFPSLITSKFKLGEE